MSAEKMKEIKINVNTWGRLKDIQRKLGFRKWSATIDWLLDQSDSKGETVPDIQEPDHKLLQDMLSPRTWDRIIQIKKERGFDGIPRVIDHLLDAFNLVHMEKVQGKVKGMDALHEIHSHIDKIRSPQELALSKLSVMDTSHTLKDQDHISDTDKTLWISCPVCYGVKPLIVEVDTTGHPLKKHEDGIEYKMVDGVLQRRFSGPDDDYLPFQVRYGNIINVEESMAISTLKRLDRKLHAHILSKLENAYFQFGGMRL